MKDVMKSTKLVLASCLIVAMSACQNGTKTHQQTHEESLETNKAETHKASRSHWAYEGEEGPNKWADLCPAYAECKGKHQSPIDLSSSLTESSTIKVERFYSTLSNLRFTNNGHSVQVNVTNKKPNVIKVEGVEFELKQFHFHCPSEHTLNGKPLAGEAHFVHVSKEGHISVLGVFIEEGKPNMFLDKLIHHLPKKVGETTIVKEEICAESAFSNGDEYFVYEGSLTTPPCTEGVNWFVRKLHMQASHDQIEALKQVMPAHNARPTQALNDRKLGTLDEV